MDEASGGSSVGEAVSGRGDGVVNEEDVYYIPERRPSLDLGPYPMEFNLGVGEGRVVGPALLAAPSYGSLRSEQKSYSMDHNDEADTRVQLDRTGSFSSFYSWDSDGCERITSNRVRDKDDNDNDNTQLSDTEELILNPTLEENPSLTVEFTFTAICDTLRKLSSGDLETFKRKLQKYYPQLFSAAEIQDLLDLVDRLLDVGLASSLQITVTLLEKMELNGLVNHLRTLWIKHEVRCELCETLRTQYGTACEDSASGGETKPLEDVFTNLCITTMCNNGPNIEHEVMTIEKLDSNQGTGKLLSTEDILSAERLKESYAKLAVVIGVAGSGKSRLARKLILDWMERRSHQHVTFLFPLPFRELKQFQGSEVSLLEIVQTLYPAARKLRDEDFRSPDCTMMFVCDGLDEYDGALDFQNTKLLVDHMEAASLDAIVVNLLRDRLLYRGLFVVTSRPQVRRYVPWDLVYDEVELCGFGESDMDEYFRRRFPDTEQADRVLENVGSVPMLRIMSHLPLFCSLVADEYERVFSRDGPRTPLPRGLTGLYTKLLLALMRRRHHGRGADADFLLSLGKLAFTMLEQKVFKISRNDWKNVGVDEAEAVIVSGLCTEFTTKPFILYQEKVLSFIHPSVQEYLAALYAFLSFRNKGKDVFEPQPIIRLRGLIRGHRILELYRHATDASLQHDDGRLDLLLRFLCGMAARSNQELLQPLCSSFPSPSSDKWSTLSEEVAALIKRRISENRNPSRSSNLQRCLDELGHNGASEATSS